MYYNLKLFGKELCRIRNNLSFTQKYLSDFTNIHIDTIRRIESGKTTPNRDTLELLSIPLKADLNKLLLNYRLTNYSEFNELQNSIERKLEDGNYEHLQDELSKLHIILTNKKMDTYFLIWLKQLYLLIESVLLKINDKNYDESLIKLIEAIRITTPKFNLNNYNKFVYNNLEIRILMNIALILSQIESKHKCLEILLFCLNALDADETEFRIKILFNLSYTCHRLDLHEKALYYSDIGIDTCISSNSLHGLALLYTRKGIAEYHLKYEDYKRSLTRAINLHDITGQDILKNILIKSCKNNYNIDI